MSRRKNIKSVLSEELQRFNQIGGYVENLHEQFLGFAGGRTELGEQEEEETDVPEEGGDDLDLGDMDDTTAETGDDLD